ncbi:hypothetical protein FRC00_003842 [Tulasnella sp. 408]|nr:hypothetical protein FRC00_003842 [Tulasnella sp. 408]
MGNANQPWFPTTIRGWLSLPKQALRALFKWGPVDAGGDDDGEIDLDHDCEYHLGKQTEVLEVWFAGCHADVGGGSTKNDDIHTLANPSLQWMVSEVLAHAPEVVFRPDAFTYDKAFSTYTVTKSDRTPKLARPRTPSTAHHAPAAATNGSAGTAGSSALKGRDAEEEIVHSVVQTNPEKDAKADVNDQLVKKRVWLLLEYIPTFQFYELETGGWDWRFRWNARRPREIYDSTPNIHESVKLRENYDGNWLTKFIPKKGKQVKVNYVKSAPGRSVDSI